MAIQGLPSFALDPRQAIKDSQELLKKQTGNNKPPTMPAASIKELKRPGIVV